MRSADNNPFSLTPLEDRVLLSATLLNAGATDMVYDPAGALHVAYYDTAARTLKYTARSATGNWDPAVTLDATPYAGAELSIALDATGRPAVAYYDGTNRDLKFAQKTRRGWTIQTLDSAGTVGHDPSLAFTPDGFPLISYYAASTADLRLASFNGTKWYVSTIDATGSVGRFSDLAISPLDGSWAIAYESQSDHTIRYAQKWGKSFTTRVIDTLPGDANWLAKPSLAFNSTGNPLVSYVDGNDVVLNRAGRKSWTRSTLVSGGVSSPDTALFVQSDAPRLLYAHAGAFSIASMAPDGTWPTADLLVSVPLAVARSGDRINLLTAGGAVTSIDPTAPSPLALAVERSGSLIHLTWSAAPAYAQQLTLERRPADCADFQKLADLTALDREYWDANLTPGQTYVYRLRVSTGTATAPFASTATLSFTIPPPALTPTIQGGGQITVSWTNVPADAVLVLERSVAGADDFQPCGTFYSGTTTFADYLEVGTNYVYRARAIVTPDLASGWTTLPVNLALPAPNLTLHVDTAAFDHVDLSWTGVPAAATSVTIERALVGDSDFWPVATLTPTATAWTDTGVTEGLAYVYRLRAGNDHAISPPSDAATARANLPPAFYPFFLVPGSAAIAVAYGDASEHELGYRVERSSDGGAHYQVLAESFEYGDFPAYEDFTAAENTTYTYRVTAVGAFADSAAFTATITTGLWSPYGLAVTVLSPTSAHFTWIDNSEHETWFSVSVQAVDGTYHSPPIFLPANTTEYNVTGLTPGKAYTFSVSSDARWMTLDYGPVELPLAMPGLAPADPRAATGPTTAHLAWTDLTSDETAWRIQRSDDGGNTFTTLTDLPAGSQSFDDASLLPGYTYTYRVFAITGGPDGAAATLTVTTAPTAPVLVRAVDLSPDVISLTWDPLAPDVESLDIVYLSPKDGKIHTMARVTDPSLGHARVWALEDGSSFDNLTYTVWLVANGPGGSTASNAITVDTRIHTLSLTIASTGPTSVDLSWVDLYPQPGEVYGLWYSTDGVTYTQCLPESGATTATLTGLQSDTTYWFRLGRWDSWAGHASLADPVMAHTSPA